MQQFDFLLGEWMLEYHIPQSALSEATKGNGRGIFKRALDDKYVFFDYYSQFGETKTHAHAVYFRDEKTPFYKVFWFESSGNYNSGTCNFINENTLFINWNDSLLIQTFQKQSDDKIVLRMENPDKNGKFEPVMEVILIRQ